MGITEYTEVIKVLSKVKRINTSTEACFAVKVEVNDRWGEDKEILEIKEPTLADIRKYVKGYKYDFWTSM